MKRMIFHLFLLVLAILLTTGAQSVSATTHLVPSQYATIQDALNTELGSGDTILVAPGRYVGDGFRDLYFPSVTLHLVSEAGAANTEIDVQGDAEINHRFAELSYYGPGAGSTIDGFTFVGGYQSWNGGAAIYDYQSGAIVRNCIFRDNYGGAYEGYYFEGTIEDCVFRNNYMPNGGEVYGYGGAMQMWYSSGKVTGCTFENNTADSAGGGIYLYQSSTAISDCILEGNSAPVAGGLYTYGSGAVISGCLFTNNGGGNYGGAIGIEGYTNPTFVENTFVGNHAKYGGVGYVDTNYGVKDRQGGSMAAAASTFTANLLAFNTEGGAFYIASSGGLTFGCNDIYGNTGGDWTGAIAGYLGLSGNISADPMFCNQAAGIYTVTANSPCAPANNACSRQLGAYGVGCSAVSIVADPTSILFEINYLSGNPADQTVGISNGGGYELNWYVTYNSGWLSVTPVEGTNSAQLVLSADVAGLSIGSYYDTLEIVDVNAANSPFRIPVQFDIIYSAPPVFDPIETTAPVINDVEFERVIAHQGEPLTINYRATDADGNIPVMGYETIPPGASFSAGTDGTAVLSWNPVTAASGQYECIITAADESQTVSNYVLIDINVAPTFSTFCPGATVEEGTEWHCDIVVSDPANPEGYTTSVTATNLPTNASLTPLGSATWRLGFSPDYTQVGESYVFDVTVDDGLRQATETVTLTAANRVLQVVEVTPNPIPADLLLNDSIVIRFNEAIDVSTMPTGVVITSAQGSTFQRNYNGDTYSLILQPPVSGMAELDTVTIVVNGGLRDLAGQWMDAPYTVTFYSGAMVFPGDANNDGIVDERDLLPIGLFWSKSGPARLETASLDFVGTMAHTLSGTTAWTPKTAVYADADGDGTVDAWDICGLGVNWSATHTLQRTEGPSEALSVDEIEGDVVRQMLAAAIECPATPGTKRIQEMLENALGEAAPALPTSLTLYGNYPNPFNPNTTISYYLPEAGQVTVEVYNLLGRRVASPVDQALPAGYHTVDWDGRDNKGTRVASGLYLYRLVAGSDVRTGRMMLLK